jgi:hypothetical protein
MTAERPDPDAVPPDPVPPDPVPPDPVPPDPVPPATPVPVRSDVSAGLDVLGARDRALLPFQDLRVPLPVSAAPPEAARWLAFAGVLIGGLLGGLIGYGVGELLGGGSVWAATGALLGALIGAAGVGVVSALTLRAMSEWRTVEHPEATKPSEADNVPDEGAESR